MAINPSEYPRQVIGLEFILTLWKGSAKNLRPSPIIARFARGVQELIANSDHRSAWLVQELKTNSDHNLRPRAIIS